MRRYPVVNLGQIVEEFEGLPLGGDTLSRLCNAIDAYNAGDSSDRTMRDAVADVRSIIQPMGTIDKNAAVAQLRKWCKNPEPLLAQIIQPEPAYLPFSTYEPISPIFPPPLPPPPTTMVESTDRYIQPEPEPPTPPFVYEPVATTGSEEEPPISQPPPQPPPQSPVQPPSVPSIGEGCWYVMGQGYSWGPRPPGGESTGLSQKDCQNIMRADREIRGLPALTTGMAPPAQQFNQESQPQPVATQATSAMQPPAPPQQPTPVATGGPGACPPGQFWDGVRCRGSVSSMPGGYGNVAFGGGGGMTVPFGGGGGTSAVSLMGRRYPVKNLGR